MLLLIDNYDSFAHNLARYLRQLGHPTEVVRNDQISVDQALAMAPDAIVLSPGPCTPSQAGICLELVREAHQSIPLLGICLGHQAIAEALGGRVIRAEKPVHGRASWIHHQGRGVFGKLATPLRVARYHSLIVSDLPDCLVVEAWLQDGTPMAIAHRSLPVVGWQFHPESILTPKGYEMLQAFLALAGLTTHRIDPSRSDTAQEKNVSQSDWFRKTIEYPGHLKPQLET